MRKTVGTPTDGMNFVSGQGNKPLPRPAHALSFEIVIIETEANSENGLTDAEASTRLELYGRNELADGNGVSIIKILVRQVASKKQTKKLLL